MQKIFTRSIPNHEASRKLAAELVTQYLAPAGHFSLFLEGGLGAGKTFLVKEMLAQLGVTQAVSSPTYALVNEYEPESPKSQTLEGEQPSGILNLKSSITFAHWDFYRLEDPNDFFARGFQDLAQEAGVSHFVEWPECLNPEAKACFGGKRLVLKINFGVGVGMRKVELLEHR